MQANKKSIEICNHCGADVSFSTGKFINRIPDFNDVITRKINNLDFPIGDYICEDCDENSQTDND